MNTLKNLVIYHSNCLDGTGSAWVAAQYLPKEETEYVPVHYGEDLGAQIPVREYKEMTLYILDWCPNMDDLDKCCMMFKRIVLIDHHESAIKKIIAHYDKSSTQKNLEMLLAYENEWSGAMGTALWFEEHLDSDEESLSQHWLIKAIDDRDRWKFLLPDTEAINEGLHQAMALSDKVNVIGQLVNFKPAVFGTTSGLAKKFGPKRVHGVRTPMISGGCAHGFPSGALWNRMPRTIPRNMSGLVSLGSAMITWRFDFARYSATVRVLTASRWS